MQTPFESCVDFAQYNSNATKNIQSVLTNVPVFKKDLLIPADSKVDITIDQNRSYYLIKNGCLTLVSSTGPVITFEEGDLVGLHESTLPLLSLETPDFAVVVDVYREADILHTLQNNPLAQSNWHEYACRTLSLLLQVLSSCAHSEPNPIPLMKNFDPGDIIIQQGADSNGVFTLVEGLADVKVDGVLVGEVQGDEIFGAIAAITETPRSASVIARTHCLVMEVSKDKFRSLLRTHPSLVTKLIEDMATTIKKLNAEVVGLSKGKCM